MRRRLTLLLIPVAVFLIADQVVQRAALRDGWLRGRRVAPFDPPLFNPAQEAALARLRAAVAAGVDDGALTGSVRFDGELGWCVVPGTGDDACRYDARGARVGDAPLPPSPAPGVRRLCVIGGSFTHGDEVAGADAWPAVLDRTRADLEVANLGVGAYGIDQAWMRYLRDGAAFAAHEVWLGVMPMALPRCLGVYRPALRHHEVSVAFKPRYRLDGDALVRVACPASSLSDLVRLVDDAEAFFAATAEVDAYVARWPAAWRPRGSHPAHWFATSRLALTALEGRAQARDPAPMLRDPSSELSRVATAIVRDAAARCAARGVRFRVVVLPDGKSLRQRAADGAGFWEPWLAGLAREGVATLDLSATLVDRGFLDDPANFAPQGHYSARGNAAVAEALAASTP